MTPKDLHPAARNELKTLTKENAERVARHLAMAAQLIDDDPALAHEHALAASRHAGRIPVARESVAITAYALGDFALALRELRTYRRLSGRDDQIALMVDCERGVGRPERALELGRSVDRATLPTDVRVHLAIAMSGAWLDRGDATRALQELEIPEADPDRAFEWSPALFAARATVLEDLGRTDEAARWAQRADVAAAALDEAHGVGEHEVVIVEDLAPDDDDDDDSHAGEVAAGSSDDTASSASGEVDLALSEPDLASDTADAAPSEADPAAEQADAAPDVLPDASDLAPDEADAAPGVADAAAEPADAAPGVVPDESDLAPDEADAAPDAAEEAVVAGDAASDAAEEAVVATDTAPAEDEPAQAPEAED